MADIMDYLLPQSVPQELGLCDEYSLVERIGDGGMAVVFLAISPKRSAQRVALKIAKPDLVESHAVALERFDREISFQGSLNCQHVVRLLNSGSSPKAVNGLRLPWFAMELIKGRSLADKLAEWKRLTQVEVARLGKQICRGLASIHEHDMVHRDLKPSNVLLDIVNSERALIGDFGVARSRSIPSDITQGQVGTFSYIAPEVWDNPDQASFRSDLYSVGCILYQGLLGKPAFDQQPLASKRTPRMHLCDLDSRFNRGLADLIYRLMDPDPAKRCESAAIASREFEIAGMCISDSAVDDGYLPGLTDHSTCEALSEVARKSFFLPEFRGASHTTLLLGLAGQKLAARKLHRRIERFVDSLILHLGMGSVPSSKVNVAIKQAEKTFLSLEKRMVKTLEELKPNERFQRFREIYDQCTTACSNVRSILQLLQGARHNSSQLAQVHALVHEMLYDLMHLEVHATRLEVFVSDLLESSIAQFSVFRDARTQVTGFSPFLKQNRIKTDLTV